MTYEEYIKKVNRTIEQLAKENKHSRSYVRIIRPYNETKVNIIGSFEKAIHAEEKSRKDSETDSLETFNKNSKKSFGMIATETFEKYKDMIFGDDSVFATEERFKAYVDANYENFCVDFDEFKSYYQYAKDKGWFSEYDNLQNEDEKTIEEHCRSFRKALYARCILQVIRVGNFKMHFNTTREVYDEVKKIIRSDKACVCYENRKGCDEGKDYPYLMFSGRISSDKLKQISEEICFKEIKLVEERGVLEVYPKNQQGGIEFEKLYQKGNEKYYQFRGSAIYSGVIPRLCQVNYIGPEMSNMDMQRMELVLGRTSYMTMYALNRPDILEHPFLDCLGEVLSWKVLNCLFDEIEIKLQQEFWQAIDEEDEKEEGKNKDFVRINQYLTHSWNVHNVNISGNLITSDNYCIYTKRGKRVVDSENYYCSVNGGSEIFDPAVPFYSSSVVEDLPTIKYSCEPVYFGGELTREAIGELGIIDSSTFWNYYGISLMGDIEAKYNSNKKQTIWFHFNVLGERQCLDTFDQIIENKKLASENFESSGIFGYRLQAFENLWQIVGMKLKEFVQLIMDNTDVLTLIGLFAAMYLGQGAIFDIPTVISICFGVLGFFTVIYKTVEFFKNAKQKRTVVSYQNRKRILFEKLLKNRRLGELSRKDPIYMALIALRFDRVFRT